MESKPRKRPKPVIIGVIRADEVYTLDQLYRRFGHGPRTVREAFDKGLRCMTFGRRKYVWGQDLIEFLRNQNQPGDQNS